MFLIGACVQSIVDMATVFGVLLVEGVAQQVDPIEAAAFGTVCAVLLYTEVRQCTVLALTVCNELGGQMYLEGNHNTITTTTDMSNSKV